MHLKVFILAVQFALPPLECISRGMAIMQAETYLESAFFNNSSQRELDSLLSAAPWLSRKIRAVCIIHTRAERKTNNSFAATKDLTICSTCNQLIIPLGAVCFLHRHTHNCPKKFTRWRRQELLLYYNLLGVLFFNH